MKTTLAACATGLFFCGTLAAGPSYADKPGNAGKGQGQGQERNGKHAENGPSGHGDKGGPGNQAGSGKSGGHFGTDQRAVVRNYYVKTEGGRCPPGLAKKNNGCMPPGQARKWHVGQPLPRDVVYYQVPAPLVSQLGAPPSGHKYVRVAGDILMIAIGTGLIVDAIQDLGRT